MRFQSNTMKVTLEQHVLRDAALRASGQDPRLLAIKPGTRRQRDRKAMAARGYTKHKAHAFM